jgi:hypothetical protein
MAIGGEGDVNRNLHRRSGHVDGARGTPTAILQMQIVTT